VSPPEEIRAACDEAERLDAKATPGPWTGDRYDGTVKYRVMSGDATVLVVDHKNMESGFLSERGDHDEAWVLRSRTLLPSLARDARALLDEVVALRERAERAERERDEFAACAKDYQAREGHEHDCLVQQREAYKAEYHRRKEAERALVTARSAGREDAARVCDEASGWTAWRSNPDEAVTPRTSYCATAAQRLAETIRALPPVTPEQTTGTVRETEEVDR
jgi:hypothetical protein